jgi:hypothetical protein
MSPPKSRISYRRILYRAALLMALGATILSRPVRLAAQEERPQITPGERKVPRKKDAGPRALAVLQLSATTGKSSLVPIAILVNGKFWDASAYKADPVPMSLDSGTVYEVERTGNSLGLFTVGGAMHRTGTSSLPPWIGTGAYALIGTESASKTAQTDPVPVGIDKTDDRPRLTRDPNAVKNTPAASKGSPSKDSQPASRAPSSSDSDGPPRLTKPPSLEDPAPAPTEPKSSSPPASGSTKPDEAKAETKPKIPTSDSGAGMGYRPILRRDKVTKSFGDEEIPGYSRPGARSSDDKSGDKKPVELTALNTDIQLIPAISDASGPAPKSYAFEWLKGEEQDRRKQMLDLATAQVQAYIAARAKGVVAAQPAHPAAKSRTPKPPAPILENVQMIAYDLWNSNQPIILLSAQAHMPPPPAGTAHSEIQSELQYSVLVVAYPDLYNNLRKLYSGVTDKFHLDLTPKLDLIDAVDADGDGRGELLFRETSDQGTGWVVYRATADKLWKMFDSLNPE